MRKAVDNEQRVSNIFQTYRQVNKAFLQIMTKVAHHHGITPIQLMALRMLKDQPHAGLSQLAEKLNLNSSTTSGVIDRMVKANLVFRERSGSDRRAVRITLTEKGMSLWTETEATRFKLFQPLLQLSEEEERDFMRIQTKILSILKNVNEGVE